MHSEGDIIMRYGGIFWTSLLLYDIINWVYI